MWLVLLFGLFPYAEGEAADASANLSPKGADLRQVNIEIEVKGDLLIEPQGKSIRRLPILAKGKLEYDERVTPQACLRNFRTAQAEIAVAGGAVSPRLAHDRRLIAVDSSTGRPQLYSPQGPISREQLELVEVQGSTAVADRLLPRKTVQVGQEWETPPQALAAVLLLDIVHRSDVKSTLVKIDDGQAVVELDGQVSGSVGGVPSDVTLKATYCFDLEARRIGSLALSIGEKRGIGAAEPGFEISARIQVLVDSLEESAELRDEAIAGLPRKPSREALLLSLVSKQGGYRLLHPRRWRMVFEDEAESVLRLIDRGTALAQCNIHRLDDLLPGKRPSLEQFKGEVKKSLGESFGEFVDAQAENTPSGLHVLRISVSGEVSEVPVRWIYFHLCDEAGRQVTCVFTLEQENLPQLGDDDLLMTGSVELQDRALAPKPTAANPPPATPRTSAKPAESAPRQK